MNVPLPFIGANKKLCNEFGEKTDVAESSATLEDFPDASFAGQH